MEPGNVSAIISAAAAISGVVLGNVLSAFKEALAKRAKESQETSYLGVIVVSHLDRFATGCLDVALDDGSEYGRPAGERGEYVPVATPPEFLPLSISVDWRLLPKNLMYSILRLPDKQDQLEGSLAAIQEFNYDPPDHGEFFWARQRGYAVLGLQASKLALELRKHAVLPVEESDPGDWNRDKKLEEVIADIDGRRKAYESRQSKGISV
ncbi:hypothetical protein SAMN03159382_02398 [Pseudomonas sp. NFACC23-1]|uniref:hypothetical protein n=1 Tax=unclassified Pseudomonas TaxID=196821 RepID=UPI00088B2B64|nr:MULTISPECIES: hypothetical protein [unclassified Pseudomonas]SDB28295.1 hypothetical protein SAMN03159386_02058 [Pseudomonas sp. NFACC17-2]SEJ41517.1 hypothetical protein SAMN03159382_02398 [Pseudomonas sp. NFACC23-1]SFW66603.1 hypothetical protein SAMN05660640_02606 [Pseudomonas sp. NFACC16-2]